MTDTLTPATQTNPAGGDGTGYDERVAALSTVPFWHLGEFHEPAVPERAHVWHWDDVVPELYRSREVLDAGAASLQRRALLLRNPGLPGPGFGATHTLVAAYQMLFPGESAPVHAHSFSALRFGASGSGARMIVDGQAVPLCPGDLVLTPAGCWHGHVHPGGDEPVVWFDGLDVPFVMSLRAGFFQPAPNELAVAEPVPTSGTELGGAGLWPAEEVGPRHSPLRRYPWEQAYPVLQRLMARDDEGYGVQLDYRNPLTGGPALATISCSLVGLAAGERTRPTRETASSVYFVARGAGSLDCDGRRRELQEKDVVALPSWTWQRLSSSGDELVLFRISDRPIQDAFGLYRAETAEDLVPVAISPRRP